MCTPGCGVRNNRDVARITDPELASLVTAGDALVRRFVYDSLYRLVRATGRECKDIPSPRPWTDDPRCGFNSGSHGTPNKDNATNLTVPYWEEYAYDPAGNMVTMKHGGNGAPWTRHFGMGHLTPGQWAQVWPNHLGAGAWVDPPGNCLTHVGDNAPTTPETHLYDPNGNLVRETTSRHFEWDHSDRLRVFRNQTPEAGTAPADDRWAQPSIHAHYLYDADGQRVMKLVRRQGGQYDVRVYMDGLLEHYRWDQKGADADKRQNARLHVMDDQQQIAIRRMGQPHPDDKGPEVQYHLGDHLGSSNVVIDDAGAWVNREEYTPYGETSFGSFARKRYRFTGKERDEESGLCYFGVRYYSPWLMRWLSCDPAGQVDGLNLFVYVRNNPVNTVDVTGLAIDAWLPGVWEQEVKQARESPAMITGVQGSFKVFGPGKRVLEHFENESVMGEVTLTAVPGVREFKAPRFDFLEGTPKVGDKAIGPRLQLKSTLEHKRAPLMHEAKVEIRLYEAAAYLKYDPTLQQAVAELGVGGPTLELSERSCNMLACVKLGYTVGLQAKLSLKGSPAGFTFEYALGEGFIVEVIASPETLYVIDTWVVEPAAEGVEKAVDVTEKHVVQPAARSLGEGEREFGNLIGNIFKRSWGG